MRTAASSGSATAVVLERWLVSAARSDRHRLGARSHAKRLVDLAHVVLDRVLGDIELSRNFAVGKTLQYEAQYLLLPLAQILACHLADASAERFLRNIGAALQHQPECRKNRRW